MTIKEDLVIELAMATSANRYLWRAWDQYHEGWTESELDGFLSLLDYVCAKFQDLRNHVNDTVSEELALVATDDYKTHEYKTQSALTVAAL